MWPEETATDSRGGGEIRGGNGGSEKQINWWSCQFAHGRQRRPRALGEERKMDQLKDGSGGMKEHHTWLGVCPNQTVQAWRRRARMGRIRSGV